MVLENEMELVLVTGAAGLLGSELVHQLIEQNYRVRALYHSTPIAYSHQNLEVIQCDILDVVRLAEVMQGVTRVFHCAAIVSFAPADELRMMKINVEGTANVVNACLDAGVKKLVHVSSVAALGRIRKGEVVTEKMVWSKETSNSMYGKSKYLAELEVYRGYSEGLPMVMVNPSVILGGSDWHSGSGAIFKTVYNEFKWYSEGVSGFVDVKDVARAMILLMNSPIVSEKFILNSENLTFRQVFVEIARCFGKRAPYKEVTPLMAAIVWRLEALRSSFTGKKHLVTRETANTSLAKVYFDNGKILKALPGFIFTKISDTIMRTCEEMKRAYRL